MIYLVEGFGNKTREKLRGFLPLETAKRRTEGRERLRARRYPRSAQPLTGVVVGAKEPKASEISERAGGIALSVQWSSAEDTSSAK